MLSMNKTLNFFAALLIIVVIDLYPLMSWASLCLFAVPLKYHNQSDCIGL